MSEPAFWSCDDACEELTCTELDEAVEAYLDSFYERGMTKEAYLAALPKIVEVYGYERRGIDGEYALDPDRIIEDIVEMLDDEGYGDPDGYLDAFTDENLDRVRTAAINFLDTFREYYRPWSCEQTVTEKVNVDEWLKDHPDFLEGVA